MLAPSFAALIVIAVLAVASCNLVPLSARQKQDLLEAHNRLRSETALGRTPGQPSAANMAILKWDDRLALSADRWVQRCMVGHDKGTDRALPGFQWVGQNFAGGFKSDFTTFVQMWFDEYKSYSFNSKSCSAATCGHYTQVVWAKTTLVGCAVAKCSKYPFHIVCNYATGGNFNSEFPYAKGAPGSGCRGQSQRGLCL